MKIKARKYVIFEMHGVDINTVKLSHFINILEHVLKYLVCFYHRVMENLNPMKAKLYSRLISFFLQKNNHKSREAMTFPRSHSLLEAQKMIKFNFHNSLSSFFPGELLKYFLYKCLHFGTQMAALQPRREKEPLKRQGKESGKRRWGEDKNSSVLILLSALLAVGCHNNGAA